MQLRPRGHGAAAVLGAGKRRIVATVVPALQGRAVPLPWTRHRQGDLGAVPREAAHAAARLGARGAAAAVLGCIVRKIVSFAAINGGVFQKTILLLIFNRIPGNKSIC